MLKKFFVAVLISLSARCFAQETVTVKKRLANGVIEKYVVLKADKNIREGLYQALEGKTALASGSYKSNKRTGLWHFYNHKGVVVQNFDYNKMALMFEADEAPGLMTYAFDMPIVDTGKVTRPIRIGGNAYGFLPYLKLFEVPRDIRNEDYEAYHCLLQLLVSPGGRLAEYKLTLMYGNYNTSYKFNIDLLDAYDKIFLPATIDGQPVSSTIVIPCRITAGGDLKFINQNM
jgi:hypothetical protein